MARIIGTTGGDDLVGGSADEVFVFADDHGDDTISNFGDGKDLIDLRAVSGISRFEDLTITQDGDDVLIDTGEGTIRLDNFSIDDLDASDFRFRIDGDSGDNTLRGGAGEDLIYGGDGDDILYGGAGADEMRGGKGNDTFYVDDDDNYVYGGKGDDTFHVGDGDDTHAYGGGGNDTFYLGNGDGTHAYGGKGDDTFHVGNGNDNYVYGGKGDDTFYGGTGDDRLQGEEGNDTLYGGVGDDRIKGGDGNDTIYGGAGDDRIYGGAGNDTFVVGINHGNDRIKDFTDGEDTIDLSATGITDFADLTITQSGNDVIISTGPFNTHQGGNGTIRLEDFSIDDLDADDFLFADPPAPIVSVDEL